MPLPRGAFRGYPEGMRLLALLLSLALPASAALSPSAKKKAAKAKPDVVRPVRKKKLVLKKAAPAKKLKVLTRASAAVAETPKEVLPVPKPPLKPVAMPDHGKASTSAKFVVSGNKNPAKKDAPKSAPAKKAAPAAAKSAGLKAGKKTPDLTAPAVAKPKGFKPGGPTSVKLGEPRVNRARASGDAVPRSNKSRRASASGFDGGGGSGGGGGGRGGGGGGGSRGGGSKKSSFKKPSGGGKRGGGGGESGGGAEKPAPAKKTGAVARGVAVSPQVPPAPPALPVIEDKGVKRLARPAALEPAVSTIAVAGRKAYNHEGALWLAKAEGRPAPALLVDGVWRLYEVKGSTSASSVTLRPAFPGMFAGKPDDPNLILIADPAARFVARVEGTRASGWLWADPAKPRSVASLGDGVANVLFAKDKTIVVRRDGSVSVAASSP